jgi:hypothetical protein
MAILNDCKYRKRISPGKSEPSPIMMQQLILIQIRKVIFARSYDLSLSAVGGPKIRLK